MLRFGLRTSPLEEDGEQNERGTVFKGLQIPASSAEHNTQTSNPAVAIRQTSLFLFRLFTLKENIHILNSASKPRSF